MPWFPIPDIGQHGIIRDIPAHLLPPGAWSNGQNVHFRNDRVFRRGGSRQVYTGIGSTAATDPYWGINIDSGTDSYWIYSSKTHLYSILGNTVLPITRHTAENDPTLIPYDMEVERLWNGGILSGIVVLNNGNDIPQTWVPGVDPAQNLANWPEGITAKVLRPFGYFLIAMNLTNGNERSFNRIRWSTSAVPGTLPTSWDITDPAIDAGETDLPDPAGGEIVDARRLRDWLIIYKNNSTWAMRYVGGPDIFTFTEVFPTLGILEADCVAPFAHKGGQYHCMFTGDDVLVHDGRSIIHNLEGRLARSISRELSSDNWRRSFVVNLPSLQENWICYPTEDTSTPHRAITWNYEEDTISLLDLPEDLTWISRGIIEGHDVGLTWDSDMVPRDHPWDDDQGRWDEASVQQRNLRPLGFILDGDQRGLRELSIPDSSDTFNSFIRREDFGYSIDGRTLQPIFDPGREKLIRAIRLYFSDETVAPFMDVNVWAKDSIGSRTRKVSSTYNPNLGYPHWDLLVANGRAFDFEIRPKSNALSRHWELLGMEIDLEVTNTYYGAGTQDDLGRGETRRAASSPFGRGRII